MAAATVHPEVLWAQRSSKSDPTRNIVYLTIAAPDIPKTALKFDLQATKVVFSGKSVTKNVTYAGDFEFYEEIDPQESKISHTDRDIELVLRKKKAEEEFWPRLLKEKAKVHWLKTDFDKWVDEDEQDSNEDEDWMAKSGGMEGGMGGMGGEGGFEGIDFSKFGSGPGGPGGDLSEELSDDEELPEDDEEMPPLEDEEKHASAVKADKPTESGASKKIEELE